LQDRLMNCSDYSQSYLCGGCGSLLSCIGQKCKLCDSVQSVQVVAVPFVLRYLVAELMAMNINMRFSI
jgi:DNA-directed RNA polymerase I subunit RPA2